MSLLLALVSGAALLATGSIEARRPAKWESYSETYSYSNSGGWGRGTEIGVQRRPRFRRQKQVRVAFIELKVNEDNHDYVEQVAVARERATELAFNLNMDGSV